MTSVDERDKILPLPVSMGVIDFTKATNEEFEAAKIRTKNLWTVQ